MHQYRHIITRMRLGDSDRQIAKAKLMGRNKSAELRKTAEIQGWLSSKSHLPDDEELAKVLKRKADHPTQSSSVKPFSKEVEDWVQQGVTNIVIHRALREKHGLRPHKMFFMAFEFYQ